MYAGLLFGGIGAGSGLAWLLAPGSDFAAFVGFMALPLVFGLAVKAWLAAATAAMSKRLFGALFTALRGRRTFVEAARDNLRDLQGNMPGTGVFLPFGVVGGLAAGGLTWLAETAPGIGPCLAAWLALCVGYGLLLRWLARTGRLPMPESA